jgi:hypothetical protein
MRRGSSYRVIEKAEHFYMRVVRQWFDQLAAPQNFQQLRWRCAGREQSVQLANNIGVNEAAGLECTQDLPEQQSRRGGFTVHPDGAPVHQSHAAICDWETRF